MSLNRSSINPLNLLNLRRLPLIPEHFSKIKILKNQNIRLLQHWIEFNLNSRYAIQDSYELDNQRKFQNFIIIGLEDPKELLVFTLGCPYIKTKKEDLF